VKCGLPRFVCLFYHGLQQCQHFAGKFTAQSGKTAGSWLKKRPQARKRRAIPSQPNPRICRSSTARLFFARPTKLTLEK